ncbi:hypothetical protein [Sphingomonas kyeonggiensis]|uniref:Uncharacterized protein n=1 Tax=Sphingomonas kyeonggiensis TaxID=1268553 RepID=A0A7W6JS87_9SPHN|nr:hypothetical protein [Sphingomonas kyeonggiensis]MBB4098667.1 hypothetical protein [Sphingomonas kyeonggiensis]
MSARARPTGDDRPVLRQLCVSFAMLLGVLGLLNGSYMLISPVGWYFAVPGVTTTGPFNQHFIRDIGIIFLFIGAAFLIGTVRQQMRAVLWGGATLWLACHALFHFWEVAAGICGPSVLLRDFPAVTLPALIGAGLTLFALRDPAPARP